jgi:hypothetical protein
VPVFVEGLEFQSVYFEVLRITSSVDDIQAERHSRAAAIGSQHVIAVSCVEKRLAVRRWLK